MSGRAGIDREAAHIREAMEEALDEHAKKRRACARSKGWWSQEIADLRINEDRRHAKGGNNRRPSGKLNRR